MMTGLPLSIDEQVFSMRAVWPRFVVKRTGKFRQFACWSGEASPQFSKFTLEVRYQLGDWPQVIPKVIEIDRRVPSLSFRLMRLCLELRRAFSMRRMMPLGYHRRFRRRDLRASWRACIARYFPVGSVLVRVRAGRSASGWRVS